MDNRQIVLITGCNGGIGKDLCRVFKASGYIVSGTDRHAQCQAECELYLPCDLQKLATDESVQGSFRDAVSEFAKQRSAHLKAMVNNAAAQMIGSLETLSIAEFELSLQVNVLAPFVLAKLFNIELRQIGGAIVNIGSIHSKLTKPGFSAYSTSKTALAGLTRALALEFCGDVTVNTISPAATKTDMLLDGFKDSPEKYKELAAHHPVGRIAEPEEIAQLALFLCSENARFITGADLAIDGGIGGRLHDPV
jgi:NAD(P)-dependent dehydrogenase (short-subunit alcohol dehydrogenase family)